MNIKPLTFELTGWKAGLFIFCAGIGALDMLMLPWYIYMLSTGHQFFK